jgi:hypothetical protein
MARPPDNLPLASSAWNTFHHRAFTDALLETGITGGRDRMTLNDKTDRYRLRGPSISGSDVPVPGAEWSRTHRRITCGIWSATGNLIWRRPSAKLRTDLDREHAVCERQHRLRHAIQLRHARQDFDCLDKLRAIHSQQRHRSDSIYSVFRRFSASPVASSSATQITAPLGCLYRTGVLNRRPFANAYANVFL